MRRLGWLVASALALFTTRARADAGDAATDADPPDAAPEAPLNVCLCACDLTDDPGDLPPAPLTLALGLAGAAALRRRQRRDEEDPRDAARRRVLAAGNLPPDVARRIRDRKHESE